ncbi:MAG: hypothetical protein ACXVP1_08255 [Thermoleophilia bacterium]
MTAAAGRAFGKRARRGRLTLVVVLAVVFPLATAVLWRFAFALPSDIRTHLNILRSSLHGPWTLQYPLFHLASLAVAFGHTDLKSLTRGAVIVLVAAVLLRVWVTFRVLSAAAQWRRQMYVALATLGLAVAMPLPNWWRFPQIYIGQIAINVWHNPTMIVAMPAAIALFVLGLRSLETRAPRDIAYAAGLAVVCALAKPSFLLAFLPVYVAALAWTQLRARRPGHALLVVAAACAPVVAVLAWQYTVTFGQGGVRAGGLRWAPLKAWHIYSPHPLISLLLSLAFPLACIALFGRRILADRMVRLGAATAALGILEFALLADLSAVRDDDVAWTAYVATYMLFLACVAWLLGLRSRDRKSDIAWAVFALHAAAGIFYIVRILAAASGTKSAYF